MVPGDVHVWRSPDIVSEQGSLYSMPSPLNPASIWSESSAQLSRHDQEYSTGSASSPPSALSAPRSRNSLAASFQTNGNGAKQYRLPSLNSDLHLESLKHPYPCAADCILE